MPDRSCSSCRHCDYAHHTCCAPLPIWARKTLEKNNLLPEDYSWLGAYVGYDDDGELASSCDTYEKDEGNLGDFSTLDL